MGWLLNVKPQLISLVYILFLDNDTTNKTKWISIQLMSGWRPMCQNKVESKAHKKWLFGNNKGWGSVAPNLLIRVAMSELLKINKNLKFQ